MNMKKEKLNAGSIFGAKKEVMHGESRKFRPVTILIHFLLILLVFINLFPLYWMLTFSLKDKDEIMGHTVEAPKTRWEEIETAITGVIGEVSDIEWGALRTAVNDSIRSGLSKEYRNRGGEFPAESRSGYRDAYTAELQQIVNDRWDDILADIQGIDGILAEDLYQKAAADPARQPIRDAAEAVVNRHLLANLPFTAPQAAADEEAPAEAAYALPGDDETRLAYTFVFTDNKWQRFCQATDRIVGMRQAGIEDPWEGVKTSVSFVMGDQASTLDEHEIIKIPPNHVGLPHKFAFENYPKAFSGGNMGTLFLNSLIVTMSTILITIVASFMATYAITRLVWKGRKMMNKFFMLGLTIPIHAALVPVYIIMNRIGLLGSLFSLILPYSAFSLAMGILISVGFMGDIPYDLDEAAFLDGCGVWGIFFRVILPLMMPAISTIGIYTFLQCWNELLLATVYISKSEFYTLPVGINNWASTQTSTADWGKIGAGLVIATAPTLIVYIALSKKIQAGFIAGAVKG